jgi:hypothetical protein
MSPLGIVLTNAIMIIVLTPLIYRGLLPALFKKATLYHIKKSIRNSDSNESPFNTRIEVIKKESVESGSGVGSNIYLSLWYDCRAKDILIRGKVPETQHWSLVPHDIGTSYPLNSWLDKDTLATEPDGSYEIIVSKGSGQETNVIDVAKAPLGLILFRYTNPADPQKAMLEIPVVEAIPIN